MPSIRRDATEQDAQQGGLARAVRPGDRHPVLEVELQVDRTEGEVPRRTTAPRSAATRSPDRGRRGDLELELPLLARLGDDVEALDEPLGLTGLGGLLLAGLGAELPPDLVVVLGLAAGVLHALLHPGALHPGPGLEGGSAFGVVVVRQPGLPASDGALVEVGLVAAAVGRDAFQAPVDLDDARDRRGQELAVVADDHHRRVEPEHELLEQVEALDVEVVRGLVQQVGVVAGEQQRRQTDAGGLAPGQGGHVEVQVHAQPEVVSHDLQPVVEVGAAQRQPGLQRARVGLVGGRVAVGEGLRLAVEVALGARRRPYGGRGARGRTRQAPGRAPARGSRAGRRRGTP